MSTDGVKPWPHVTCGVTFDEADRFYIFTAKTMVGENLFVQSDPVDVYEFSKILKVKKLDEEAAVEHVFEWQIIPRLNKTVDAFLHPPEKTALEIRFDKRLYSYYNLEDGYGSKESNLVSTQLEGGYPPEIDRDELPWPPPDLHKVYRPEGVLKEGIEARLTDKYGEIRDWWLVETETESGYSEYTMDTDYSYRIFALTCRNDREEIEFDSIAKVINWIEGKK